jgi:RNA polymerase sigma-70 factor, ECF subfamily
MPPTISDPRRSSQRCGRERTSFHGMSSRLRLVAGAGGRLAGAAAGLSFDDFFQEQAQQLFRRMCLVTGDRGEAEEILQDAFLSLYERWDRVASMDDPVGYLYRTAFNRWKRRSRRAARELRTLTGAVDRSDEFAGVDQRDALDRGLAALTPRQRAAIVLTEMLGYTSPEAAELLGVRDVTVRSLASQGRSTLRTVLGGDDG